MPPCHAPRHAEYNVDCALSEIQLRPGSGSSGFADRSRKTLPLGDFMVRVDEQRNGRPVEVEQFTATMRLFKASDYLSGKYHV